MEQLDILPTLSTAELRKILQDNNVKGTGCSKGELVEQVSQVLLTNMMVQELMEVTPTTPHEMTSPPKMISPTSPTSPPETITSDREQQDREYEQALSQDIRTFEGCHRDQQDMEQQDNDEQLTIDELRRRRLMYYSQDIA